MPSVALVPRRAAVPQRVAHREVEAREAVLHGAAARVAGAILRENRTVVAVAPAVMTMEITIHHVAVAEAAGDNFLFLGSQNRQNHQNNSRGNKQRLATACRCHPRLTSVYKMQLI